MVDWLRTTVEGAEDMSDTGEQGEVTRTLRTLSCLPSSYSGGKEMTEEARMMAAESRAGFRPERALDRGWGLG